MLIYLITLFLYGPRWDSSRGTAVIYSALAFLCVTMTVALVNNMKILDTAANRLLAGVAAYGFIVFAGSVISNLWRTDETVVHSEPSGIFLNLVSLAVASVMVLWYARLAPKSVYAEPSGYMKFIASITVLVGTAITLLFTFLMRIGIPNELILVGGYLIGGLATLAYMISAVMMYRNRTSIKGVLPLRLGQAFFLLGLASIIHSYILPSPSELWLVSMGLIAMAFVYAIVGIAVPHLQKLGINESRSITFTSGLIGIILAPLLIIYIIDRMTAGLTIIDLGLTVAIHFIGALMAAGAAAIVYIRCKTIPTSWQKPLILLFVYWTVAEVMVGLSPFTSIYQGTETTVPYVAGAVVATVLLIVAYKRSFSPPPVTTGVGPIRRYIGSAIVFIGYIIFSEWIRTVLIQVMGEASQDPLAASFMVSFSYLSLFAILSLFFALLSLYGGKFEFNANIAGLSALWIVIVILRANFQVWTTGWWVTEFILLGGAAVYTMYIIHKYVDETNIKSRLEQRMAIQQNILSPELQTRLQASEKLIEQLSAEHDIERRLDILSKALSELTQAEKIAKNLNSIVIKDRYDSSELVPTDLVDVFLTAVAPDICTCTPSINMPQGKCMVLANDMLVNAIRNIMIAAVNRVGRVLSIRINISSKEDEYWDAHTILEIETTNAEEKEKLMIRYTGITPNEIIEIAYAHRLVEMFSGTLKFSFDVQDTTHMTMEVLLTLPAAKYDNEEELEPIE